MKYKEVVPLVNEILGQYSFALTIRQIYYRLISDPYNLFPNTRSCYNSFDRILVKAREEEEVDENRIEDRTRQTIGGDKGWQNPERFLEANLNYIRNCYLDYDKKMWASQQDYIELWVEKDALASVVNQSAESYKVLVFPSRGFSSYTKIKEGLYRLRDHQYGWDKKGNRTYKSVYLLHLADHDPSGLNMTEDLKNRFRKYKGSFVNIKRITLNINQVRQFHLRPNPVKRADSRTPAYVEKYGNECWELDALPPDELQRIIKTKIEEFIDKRLWEKTKQEIEDERAIIKGKIDEIMRLIDKKE